MRYHPWRTLASTGVVVLGGILLGCGGGETTTPQPFDPKTPAIEQMKEGMMKANMKTLKRIGGANAPGDSNKQP